MELLTARFLRVIDRMLCRGMAFALAGTLLAFPALAAPLFSVPSSAMMPTLGEGDVILAIPPTRDLRRGDLVVYFTEGSHQISRIVALGKETVSVQSGQILIDGVALAQTPLAAPISEGCPPLVTEGSECRFLRETTPEGASYVVIDSDHDGVFDNVDAVSVPKGHIFVMSDNRDNAVDSRFAERGPISEASVIGLIDSIITTPRLTPATAERLAGFPTVR